MGIEPHAACSPSWLLCLITTASLHKFLEDMVLFVTH